MMRHVIVLSALSTSLLALSSGCDKPADEQAKANAAQDKANEAIAKANQDADQKAAEAQAEADRKIADAQAAFLKMREDYRHDTTTKLVDLDRKIADLEAKAKTATGKRSAELKPQLTQIRARREAFTTDWASIEAASAASWNTTKERLDKEWDDLKSLVDHAA